MTSEEIKLQCLRLACDILGVGSRSPSTTQEVLREAKLIFDYVTEEDDNRNFVNKFVSDLPGSRTHKVMVEE